VEQARRKVAEVSRCIDQTHRQFRHDVIWSGMCFTTQQSSPSRAIESARGLTFASTPRAVGPAAAAGTKAENRGWSLDDVIPIHCFMFGLQTFLRQSSQLHTVQFRWYSRSDNPHRPFHRHQPLTITNTNLRQRPAGILATVYLCRVHRAHRQRRKYVATHNSIPLPSPARPHHRPNTPTTRRDVAAGGEDAVARVHVHQSHGAISSQTIRRMESMAV
jgi:hypothetical protein